MSILNCHTRLTIVNCTGLPARFCFSPQKDYIRIQPLENAHIQQAHISTNASSFTEWISEWINLVSYGPTYDTFEWNVPAGATETIRLQLNSPLKIQLNWSDPSVSWEKHEPGHWSMDIKQTVELTIYLKADVGEYIKRRTTSGPANVSAIKLKPYLEIACDEELPFVIEKNPIANMFWSPQINIQQIVNPDYA